LTAPTESPRANHRLIIRLCSLATVLTLFVVFLVQNGSKVPIHFLFWHSNTSLSWALLVAGVLGLILGVILPRMRRVITGFL
jgi:uncharacterized integral membrane protein